MSKKDLCAEAKWLGIGSDAIQDALCEENSIGLLITLCCVNWHKTWNPKRCASFINSASKRRLVNRLPALFHQDANTWPAMHRRLQQMRAAASNAAAASSKRLCGELR